MRRALVCAALVMALSLAAAPAIKADKRGPGAIVAEVDHRAYPAKRGHRHDMPSGQHGSGNYDHVSMAVPAPPARVIFFLCRSKDIAAWVNNFAFGQSVPLIGGVWWPISTNAYVIDAVSPQAFGLDQAPRNHEDSSLLWELA